MQRAGVRRIVCDHSSQKHPDGGDFDFMEESKETSKADIEPISEGKAESGERRRGRRNKQTKKKKLHSRKLRQNSHAAHNRLRLVELLGQDGVPPRRSSLFQHGAKEIESLAPT
jgi:hypothetical protein